MLRIFLNDWTPHRCLFLILRDFYWWLLRDSYWWLPWTFGLFKFWNNLMKECIRSHQWLCSLYIFFCSFWLNCGFLLWKGLIEKILRFHIVLVLPLSSALRKTFPVWRIITLKWLGLKNVRLVFVNHTFRLVVRSFKSACRWTYWNLNYWLLSFIRFKWIITRCAGKWSLKVSVNLKILITLIFQ